MKEKKLERVLPAYPLITHDPYFSVWDTGYLPTGAETIHWSGAMKRLLGTAVIDGKKLRFLGVSGNPSMTCTKREVTPLTTSYRMEAEGVAITFSFTSPLLPDDLDVLSTPITYVRFGVEFTDGKKHRVEIRFFAFEGFLYSGEAGHPLVGEAFPEEALPYGYLGKMRQTPLNGSGDHLTADWGYLFFASREGTVSIPEHITSRALLYSIEKEEEFTSTLLVGYDDTVSLEYFGSFLKGYWAREGKSIVEALKEFSEREEEILSRCAVFDETLLSEAKAFGGEDYALVVTASYRQSVAAHKMAVDEKGKILFISKENDSNGCAATADVSYPSAPLYLLYCPELVKGMLRPIFKFAKLPLWKYDFAPHDAGRYPILNGQVYGAKMRNKEYLQGSTGAPFYLYPASSSAYLFDMQMPVEECGNMLILTYAAYFADGDTSLILENEALLAKWYEYLSRHGREPENQLCTDDFAGHMEKSANLAAKAVMGVAAYSKILFALKKEEEGERVWQEAKEMAALWLARVFDGKKSALSLEGGGWSQKYNLIWDRVFDWKLFPEEFYEKECESYLTHLNEFGLPLDSRADYTKSDWTVWVASLSEKKEYFHALISPLASYLRAGRSSVPFGDFYDTVTGTSLHFIARSVQGGVFMPLLKKAWKK